jgi:hypothetical protein
MTKHGFLEVPFNYSDFLNKFGEIKQKEVQK